MNKTKILIIGAGTAGTIVAMEMKYHKSYEIVGFLDDDTSKHNDKIEGYPVLGALSKINDITTVYDIDEVIIAIPSDIQHVLKKVENRLAKNIKVRILPSISSVILGKIKLHDLKDLNPLDFLGRPLVKSEQIKIVEHTDKKTFLVTGAAGSIGSEIVDQLSNSNATKIICVDAWEEGCFNLSQKYKNQKLPQIKVYVANIRDKERMQEIFKKETPDVVFHAAAYKHVPLMEANQSEAEKTNVQGTKNVLECCQDFNVKNFVLISTDKAVNPANKMGKTKRQAELLMKDFAKKSKHCSYIAVRFGNVLNSSGSVIPIFLKQIKNGSPITITDKNMTRYFMAIPEAVSLVLQSWVINQNGRIYVLDMGKPMKILDLAQDLIKYFNLVPYQDIDIIEIGKRPGEKMYEELSYSEKGLEKTENEKIFIAE